MRDYVFQNMNPSQSVESDCVTRAISLGTGLPYNIVGRMLDFIAESTGCDKLTVNCYSKLLEDVMGYRVRYCKHGERVRDVANKYPKNTVIIRVDGHLTCSVNGVVHDIWDCTDKKVDCYWVCVPPEKDEIVMRRPKSEFIKLAEEKGSAKIWPVMDDVMSMLKATDKTTYNAILGILERL